MKDGFHGLFQTAQAAGLDGGMGAARTSLGIPEHVADGSMDFLPATGRALQHEGFGRNGHDAKLLSLCSRSHASGIRRHLVSHQTTGHVLLFASLTLHPVVLSSLADSPGGPQNLSFYLWSADHACSKTCSDHDSQPATPSSSVSTGAAPSRHSSAEKHTSFGYTLGSEDTYSQVQELLKVANGREAARHLLMQCCQTPWKRRCRQVF